MNLHDLKIARIGVTQGSELDSCLTYLPFGWKSAMAGVGMGLVHFFARSYRVESGKPAAYDPFWIETCLRDDRNEMTELKSRTTAKVDGFSWEPPLMALSKPFGAADEAARVPCVCGRSAYVVGSREFPSLGRSAHHAFRQALYALCLACPKLTLLAERADTALVKLHS